MLNTDENLPYSFVSLDNKIINKIISGRDTICIITDKYEIYGIDGCLDPFRLP
jgi:hypothetical protein